jgi:cytochrome P450
MCSISLLTRKRPSQPTDPVNIAGPEFKANPFPYYARLRDESPVCRVTLPTKEPAWLITRYADVVTVLKDERFVKDTANALTPEQVVGQRWFRKVFVSLRRNMLSLDPPDHTRLRALVQKAFTPRMVEQMRPRIEALTDGLLDAVQSRGRMDLIRDYALPLPTTIIAEMLGVPAKDRHRFHRWSNVIMSAASSTWGLRDDPALVKPAVEELLRYASPVEMATERYAREDVTVAGVTIPRGEMVLAVLASANRDERQFPHPDALDITREPNKHLAFGLGTHFCLGAPLARLEGQIAIGTLLRRARELRLAVSPDALRWRRGLLLRGLESLPVAFDNKRHAEPGAAPDPARM